MLPSSPGSRDTNSRNRPLPSWPQAISPLTGALALLLAVNLADLILNATLTPITWMISGALLAQAEAWGRSSPSAQPREAAVESAPRPRRPVL